MSHATAEDGVRLYQEETGSGTPLIFVHEYAGDYRSWEPQVRHFGQRYRAITFNARGYPPSDVPADLAAYSQDRAADDIAALLHHLEIDRAHVVGLSMGGFATLHFGFRHPSRAVSLTVAGCGYGAEPAERNRFRAEAEASAVFIDENGMEAFAAKFTLGPTRVQFGLVSQLYRTARLAHDVSAITSGNPQRIARRAKNKIVGPAMARAGLWRLLWGR
jgi:pimeloyl-ACP methyl ester carboxylesterase